MNAHTSQAAATPSALSDRTPPRHRAILYIFACRVCARLLLASSPPLTVSLANPRQSSITQRSRTLALSPRSPQHTRLHQASAY
eukprot:2019324-Pleurochrysis_carterae.AAC.1